MKIFLKKFARKLGFEIRRHGLYEKKVISLRPKKACQGNVLLSYIIDPFLLKKDAPISNAHHHDWLTFQIAQTFFELGYCVDVIHYTNSIFIPKKIYSFFVGARTNFQRIAELLNRNCIKIVHLDMAHWVFNNYSQYKRNLALQQRKGVTLKTAKLEEPNWAIEYADYATTNKGNQFNISTYCYAQKPIFQIHLPTCAIYPWPEDKNYENCRSHFLWFGSAGLIHKGLDLVLEAFAEMPDCHLTVCGPLRSKDQLKDDVLLSEETDFENTYHKELYQSSNIQTIGWINVESPKFLNITSKCVGIIFPSCSEGGGASVITCMQAGLIPIVSYESNVDVDDFGVTLKDCSIEEIKNSIRMISSLSADELKLRARRAWEYAMANHTRERFAEEYKKIIKKIMTDQGIT